MAEVERTGEVYPDSNLKGVVQAKGGDEHTLTRVLTSGSNRLLTTSCVGQL